MDPAEIRDTRGHAVHQRGEADPAGPARALHQVQGCTGRPCGALSMGLGGFGAGPQLCESKVVSADMPLQSGLVSVQV